MQREEMNIREFVKNKRIIEKTKLTSDVHGEKFIKAFDEEYNLKPIGE
jgi:hypothetical protein